MSPIWGSSGGSTWKPAPIPAPAPAPAPKPVVAPTPVLFPQVFRPIGSVKPVVPREPAITPIVPAGKRNPINLESKEHEEKETRKRKAPAKEKRLSGKFPWEFARDFFLMRAKRVTPADFLKGKKLPPAKPIITLHHPIKEPPTLYDEAPNAAPLLREEPVVLPTVLAAGKMHVLHYETPNLIPASLHADFKREMKASIEAQTGATVHSVEITGKKVEIKVGV